jgi:magnesium chelatase family protein
MVASIGAVALDGMEGRRVDVEVHICNGLPGLHLVGLPDTSVRESHARVRAAITSSGLPWPTRRIVVNLSPGDVVKEGPGFDLPIALGILAEQGAIRSEALAGLVAVGEVGLDGAVRPVRGTLSVAIAARANGMRGLVCPHTNAPEAALIGGLVVHPVSSLRSLCGALLSGAPPIYEGPPAHAGPPPKWEDLADVRGQQFGRHALEVAAAGGHHLLLVGPPGAGKSMLARRLRSILPALSEAEALEVTRVHSVAGLLDPGKLLTDRPFRDPHHSVSVAGLVGGGTGMIRPGEVSLAHRGVLFLDELASFSSRALEALREPLDEGRIRITRRRGTCSFPARFLLVGATNPCPCGFRDDRAMGCRCGDAELRLYDRRLSGPLIDRFDLLARLERPDPELLLSEDPSEASGIVAVRVAHARDEQAGTLAAFGRSCFGELSPGQLRRVFCATPEARVTLGRAARSLRLSGRGLDKVRRVALTIACLEGSSNVESGHVHEALALRGGSISGETSSG